MIIVLIFMCNFLNCIICLWVCSLHTVCMSSVSTCCVYWLKWPFPGDTCVPWVIIHHTVFGAGVVMCITTPLQPILSSSHITCFYIECSYLLTLQFDTEQMQTLICLMSNNIFVFLLSSNLNSWYFMRTFSVLTRNICWEVLWLQLWSLTQYMDGWVCKYL